MRPTAYGPHFEVASRSPRVRPASVAALLDVGAPARATRVEERDGEGLRDRSPAPPRSPRDQDGAEDSTRRGPDPSRSQDACVAEEWMRREGDAQAGQAPSPRPVETERAWGGAS